ncbi:sigma-70 family RNA polymerase sigma factor [Tundrisphaera lichenicola]|uniref:sigma-70 family RNA polymerase sigma factor n=1 Tax=Tundrisphaera lichenicola TaxID=2029860 RepID=UPI003EBBFBED
MAIGKDGATYRRIGALFHLGAIRELSDGQLLERFATGRDEGGELAFAALVERHGSMVLRVCQSVLANSHDAQDAFQATFLVLARKARGLWVRDSLGPWLHQVAYRAASGAKATAARRSRLDRRAARSAEQAVTEPVDELARILHEEIERLPERYRAPVVLCDLEGCTHEQAARHPGWPIGTVKSRQSRARDRLRERLSDRGLTPDFGRLPLIPIPPTLADVTARAAIRFLASRAIAPGSAALLAQGVIRAMILTQTLKAASALLLMGLTASGVVLLAQDGPARDDAPPATAKEDESTIKVGPGKLRVTVSGRGNVQALKLRDLVSEIEGQTTIISILPEGMKVKEGNVVCELESSLLRDRLVNQRISVKSAEDALKRSRIGREVAEYSVKEYVEGISRQEEAELRSRIDQAQSRIERAGTRLEKIRAARKRLDHAVLPQADSARPSEILAELTIDDRLESAELGIVREKLEREQAEIRLEVLEKYSKPKKTLELEKVVLACQVDEEDKRLALELEKSKGDKLERQIKACVLVAPRNGVIVYAEGQPGISPGGSIEEGATVRERQKILSVVDLDSPMLVDLRVGEPRVDRLEPGQRVLIKVDAAPNETLDGTVEEIAPRPDPHSFNSPSGKLYAVRVAIDQAHPSLNLRPGMSSSAEILVSELDNVLTVPIAALVRYDDEYHVVVKLPGGGVEWREVTLGEASDQDAEVMQGLKAGEVVATNPGDLMTEEEKRQKLGQPVPSARRKTPRKAG